MKCFCRFMSLESVFNNFSASVQLCYKNPQKELYVHMYYINYVCILCVFLVVIYLFMGKILCTSDIVSCLENSALTAYHIIIFAKRLWLF